MASRTLTKSGLASIAHHEAGHVVVLNALVGPGSVADVSAGASTLDTGIGGQMAAAPPPPSECPRVSDTADELVSLVVGAFHAGGITAQAIHYSHTRRCSLLRAVTSLIGRGDAAGDEANWIEHQGSGDWKPLWGMIESAANILLPRWHQVRSVADALVDRGSLSGDETDAAIAAAGPSVPLPPVDRSFDFSIERFLRGATVAKETHRFVGQVVHVLSGEAPRACAAWAHWSAAWNRDLYPDAERICERVWSRFRIDPASRRTVEWLAFEADAEVRLATQRNG